MDTCSFISRLVDSAIIITSCLCRNAFPGSTQCSAQWDAIVGSTFVWKQPMTYRGGYRENGAALNGVPKTP